jgi:aminopeptidase N
MFSFAVYYRGGMTLAALRHEIGDTKFFRLLQTWTALHRNGNASTAQFTALANKISGRNLDAFFHAWLWQKSKPAVDTTTATAAQSPFGLWSSTNRRP